ncbi:MAG: hypothetical protein IJZ79_02315 [Bacilli bacterium]|nr:hypothetical protein [Bacilli bacterium]
MRDKFICRQCQCYICDNNDKCLRCQSCIDNNEIIDINNDEKCENYIDSEDN